MISLLLITGITSLCLATVLVLGLFRRTVLVGFALTLNILVVLLLSVALSLAWSTSNRLLKSPGSAQTELKTLVQSCTLQLHVQVKN